MAIVKKGASKKDADKDTKTKKEVAEQQEEKSTTKKGKKATSEATVDATPSKKKVEATDEVAEAPVSTNPEDYTFRVKVDSKKYNGRTAEQVEALVFGVLGSAAKILIEKE